MADTTTIRMELDISRQRIINAFQLHTEQISEQITAGINKAVQDFDFEEEITNQCQRLIKEEVNKLIWNGDLRKAIQEKISHIVEQIVESQLNKQ